MTGQFSVRGVDVLNPRGEVVERHRTPERAEASCLRLNGICSHCGEPLVVCREKNPRDPDFGSEYDEDES